MRTPRPVVLALLVLAAILFISPTSALADGPTYWPGGALAASTTWTADHSPYVLSTGSVVVPAGMTLTVDAGVVVKFLNDGITVNGTLSAAGTEISPVVFTSLYDDAYGGDTDNTTTSAAPGQWYSLFAPAGGSIRLDHAIVRYGGASSKGNVGTDGGSLDISFSSLEQSCYYSMLVYTNTFAVRDSTISGTARCGQPDGYGIYWVTSGVSAPVITNTQFISNTGIAFAAGFTDVALDTTRFTGNTATGNGAGGGTGNAAAIRGTFAGNSILVDPGFPYVSQNGEITIKAGAVVTFEAGAILKSYNSGVTVNGALIAAGTEISPVVFTSLYDDAYGGDTDNTTTSAAPGQWYSLFAPAGGSIRLDHAVVRYGGASSKGNVGTDGGSLDISFSSLEQSCYYSMLVYTNTFAVRDSTISGTARCGQPDGYGIYWVTSGVSAPVITNTQFISNTGIAFAAGFTDVALDTTRFTGNTATGNGAGGGTGNAAAIRGTFAGNSILVDPGFPYVSQNGEITIKAGAVVTFEAGAILKSYNSGVTVNGALIAAGTEISPVVFTSLYDDAYGGDTDNTTTSAAPGQWYSLFAPAGGSIRLDHAVVRYGGASSKGNVGTDGGSLEISSSRLEQSCYYSMLVYTNTFAVRDSTISGTARCGQPDGYGIYWVTSGASAPVITNTQFISNTGIAFAAGFTDVALDTTRFTGNTATGNGAGGGTGNAAAIRGTFAGESILVDPGFPYASQNGEITIKAGAVVTFEAGAILKSINSGVTVNGALIAAGTEISPVVFSSLYDDAYGGDTDNTTTSAAPGQWYSLFAPAGGSIRLDHAIVRYGGASWNGSVGTNAGSLDISSSRLEYSCYFGMQVYSNTYALRDSAIIGTSQCGQPYGYGIDWVTSSASAPVITNSHFISNAGIAFAAGFTDVALDTTRFTGNTATGNGAAGGTGNAVAIRGTFAGNSILVDPGFPYVSQNGEITIKASAVVTFEAGAILKSVNSGVTVSGALIAAGTEISPVVFSSLYDDAYGGETDGTPAGAAPGQWYSLYAPSGGRVQMNHAIVRYGGGSGNGGVSGNGADLNLTGTTVDHTCQFGLYAAGGNVAVGTSRIGETAACGGAGNGIHISGPQTAPVAITSTTVVSSAGWGMNLLGLSAGAILDGNDVLGNGAGGIMLTSSSPAVRKNLVTGNPTGIYADAGSQPVIGGAWQLGNDIYGNAVNYGVQNAGTTTITATYNWWGSPTGPTHSANPGGTGDAVTDYVDYGSWLGASTRPPRPVVDIAPATHDFGKILALTSSSVFSFTITNTGSGPWDAGAASLTGPGAAHFQLQSGSCQGALVVPLTSCWTGVRFVPSALGYFTATLIVPAATPGGITVTALLAGEGIPRMFLPIAFRGN